MKKKIFLVTILMVALLALGYTAIAKINIESPGAMGELGKIISEPITNGDDVVIEFDGTNITRKELEIMKIKHDFFNQTSTKDNYTAAVKSLIRQKYLMREAERQGVLYSFEDAQKAALEELPLFLDPSVKHSDAALAYIKSLNVTPEEYVKTIHAKEIQIIASLSNLQVFIVDQAIKEGKLTIPSDVAENEIKTLRKAYFDKWFDQIYTKTDIKVKDEKLRGIIKK